MNPAAPDRFAPPLWEAAIAGALLVMGASPLFPLLYAPTTLEADTVVWLRYLWLPVYAATVLLGAWRWRALAASGAAFLPTAALVAFCAASVLWSIAPDVTVRRVEALAFNALLAFYLAAAFRWQDLVRVIASAALFLALGSLAICLARPDLGVHQTVNAGAWRGLWVEKNELGFMMVIGAVASLASAVVDRPRRILWLGSAALSFGLLLLSRSGTSLLCLISSATLLAGFVLARKRPIVGLLVIFVAGCLALAMAVLVLFDLGAFFQLMGKDPTLTGRTDVWAAVLRRIAERPLLGYGYAAFWHDRFGPALWVRQETHWAVPSAHNGWLEIALQLGWIGVASAAVYFGLTLALMARGLFSRSDGSWAVMYIGAFCMLSLSESEILRQNSLEWTLFMTASAKLALDARRKPAPARPKLVLVRGGAPGA